MTASQQSVARRPMPRRDRPAHRNYLAHTFACADCQANRPCRTEAEYERKADIEAGRGPRGFAPDPREWGGYP